MHVLIAQHMVSNLCVSSRTVHVLIAQHMVGNLCEGFTGTCAHGTALGTQNIQREVVGVLVAHTMGGRFGVHGTRTTHREPLALNRELFAPDTAPQGVDCSVDIATS